MTYIKPFLLLALVILLSACSAMNKVGEAVSAEDIRVELAVVYATEKVIKGEEVRANAVIERLNEARKLVDSEDTVTIAHLDEQIRERINWDTLDSADRMLVAAVLMRARERLEQELGDGILSTDSEVRINKVFDWIERTAQPYTQ